MEHQRGDRWLIYETSFGSRIHKGFTFQDQMKDNLLGHNGSNVNRKIKFSDILLRRLQDNKTISETMFYSVHLLILHQDARLSLSLHILLL